MIEYRREIDGLRALAVLPVVLFHAGFTAFRGGFVGVDVFFVISGYLITSMIVSELRQEKFSLGRFYERRARRILPALFLVMFSCLPFAWWLMLPDDFENFGQSMVATSLFANNILLVLTSGYFSLASEFKPLLHTWSLGVEEQYYLLYPLALALLFRWRPGGLPAALAAAAAVSLLVAMLTVARYPLHGFFLLPSRGWELLAGGMAALALLSPGARPLAALPGYARELAGVAGLSLIAYSVFRFGPHTPMPGAPALVPVLGTLLLILFSNEDTRVGALLRHRFLVGIGLVSYSFYLWHQPLLAFTRIASLEPPGALQLGFAITVAFVLAVLSWKFVESPFRDRARIGRKTVIAGSVGATAMGCILGMAIYSRAGFPNRWPDVAADLRAAGLSLNAAYNQAAARYRNRPFDDPGKPNLLIVGDSFARDLINAGLENNYFSQVEISYSDVLPVCLDRAAPIEGELGKLIREADVVVYGSPSIDPGCWHRDSESLRRAGVKRVVVVGTKHFGWSMAAVMRLDPARRYSYRAEVPPEVRRENALVASVVSSENFVDVLGLLSDRDGRVPVFTDRRMIISEDRRHLTKDGARFVGKVIFEHPLLADLK